MKFLNFDDEIKMIKKYCLIYLDKYDIRITLFSSIDLM